MVFVCEKCGYSGVARKSWLIIALAVLSLYIGGAMYQIVMKNFADQHVRQIVQRMTAYQLAERDLVETLEQTTAILEKKIRINSALAELLISRTEVMFTDLEMMADVDRQISMQRADQERKSNHLVLNPLPGLSYEQERARRKVENTVRELWYFLDYVTDGDSVEISMAAETSTETLSFPGETSRNSSRPQFWEAQAGDILESEQNEFVNYSDSYLQWPVADGDWQRPGADDIESINQAGRNMFEIVENHDFSMKTQTPTSKKKISLAQLKSGLKGYKQTLGNDLSNLCQADAAVAARDRWSRKLGRLVQRRLVHIQNPPNCSNTRRLVCGKKSCGFSCQIHHIIYCLITAYATERMLVVSPGSISTWDGLVKPLSSTCDISINSSPSQESYEDWQNWESQTEIHLRAIDDQYWNPGMTKYTFRGVIPLALPADLASKLQIFHGNPALWWIGQIAAYVLRPTREFQAHLSDLKEDMGFERPIVGVQVRRTDKLDVEASFHALDEYMVHVEEYYDQLEISRPGVKRTVYLATDAVGLITKAREEYPSYTFLGSNDTEVNSPSMRGSLKGTESVLTDVYFLSRTDFLVCTLSSQVCRLAYEWMQTLHGDASARVRSLDDIYYFGGQDGHHLRVVESHRPGNLDILPTIAMNKGDVIAVDGNLWTGFSVGSNLNNQERGFYPSYKVEDQVHAVQMPEYPEVPLDDD